MVGAKEAFEDALDFVRFHADAPIEDAQPDFVAVVRQRHADGDVAAARRVFVGVRQDVAQGLGQLGLVAADQDRLRRHVELDRAAPGRHLEVSDDLARHLWPPELTEDEVLVATCFDAGEVEQIIDDQSHQVGIAVDGFEEVALRGRVELLGHE